jgi:hypothetical protein
MGQRKYDGKPVVLGLYQKPDAKGQLRDNLKEDERLERGLDIARSQRAH